MSVEFAKKMAFFEQAFTGDAPGAIFEDITLEDGCVVRETWNPKTNQNETRLISKPPGYDLMICNLVLAAKDRHGKSGLRGLSKENGGKLAPHSCIPEGLEHQFRGEMKIYDPPEGGDAFDDPKIRARFHAWANGKLTLQDA